MTTAAATPREPAALAAVPTPPGGRLRAPRDADADDLVALVGAAFDEHPGCVLDLDDLDADLLAWASHLAAAGAEGWVVVDADHRVVAMVAAGRAGATGPVELKRLYVDADQRRRGLGAALVALVEAWAADRGATVVELWSDTRFGDAHRLYERLGYRRGGETRQLHDPSDTTEVRYERRLDA